MRVDDKRAETFEDAVLGADKPFHFEGDTVLVYRGSAAAVHLVTWMPRFPSPPPFSRIRDGTWFLRLPLPSTARIEYRLSVQLVGPRGGKRHIEMDDPANPPSASNPFGTNSVLTGPAYQAPWYVEAPPAAGNGHLVEVRVTSQILGGRRHHHVYLPAGHDFHKPYPVLLVHDGSDFRRFGEVTASLDRLIERGQVAPVVAVLLDPWERVAEYAANPLHSRHLAEEVLPHLRRRLRIQADREHVGVMGSSLGAAAALEAAWQFPELIGRVALLSGSFAHRVDEEWPGAIFEPVLGLLEEIETEQRLEKTRIYQSVGRYEGLCDFNRRLAPVLRAGGSELRYLETWDGHHWGAWRDRLGEALSFLFPGPAGPVARG